MFRSLIAFAALACSAMLAMPASAAPPLEPMVVHALASADDVAMPIEAVVTVAPAKLDAPEPMAKSCIVSQPAPKTASIATFAVRAHRVHVDPGRSVA